MEIKESDLGKFLKEGKPLLEGYKSIFFRCAQSKFGNFFIE